MSTLTVYKAPIDVFIQDQFSPIVDLYLHEHLGSNITLTSNTTLDDTSLSVVAGHGAVAGNLICLKEGKRFYQGGVVSTDGVTINLDTPLDFAYTTAATCTATSKEMNVDGSSTTRPFHIQPNAGVKWDIVRVLFFVQGTGAMDSAKFGDQTALTNGIVLRKKDGEYKNVFNVKSNGDFANRAYDIAYDDKAPAGKTAVRIRRTFGGPSKNGVVIRLDGDSSEELQLLVRDDMTGVDAFYAIVQGHIVVD